MNDSEKKKKKTEFEKLVEKNYKGRTTERISNGSLEHAKILVKYLFRLAIEEKQDVKIMTGSLQADFYDNFSAEAKNLLNQGNRISVISLCQPKCGRFFDAVKENPRGSIAIAGEKMESIPHFVLVGNSAYRLETDDYRKSAIGVFNNTDVGSFLAEMFDETQNEIQQVA